MLRAAAAATSSRCQPGSHSRWLARLSRPCPSSSTTISSRTLPALQQQRRSYSIEQPPSPVSAGLASIPPPLAGIRVLDLTRVLAGPWCTLQLSDLGADVIKVENPKGGDDTRSWSPPAAKTLPSDQFPKHLSEEERKRWETLPDESAYFLSVNRGKRSLTLDLKRPEAQQVMKRLISQSDVFVENYLPGKLAKMGLGYGQVSQLKPDIIYASLTGYGQTGPYRNTPGYDVVVAADGGLFHITGETDRPGVKIGVAMTDLTTGLFLHGAIMAALIGRAKTGKGVHIDASLFESQVASLANVASSWLVAGKEGGRYGTAHPSIVPYQVFPTKDSYLMVGAGNDSQFKLLTDVLQRPDLSQSPSYATNGARVANRDVLLSLLSELFQQQTNDYWLQRLNGRLPIAPIRNIQQTFEHPSALERGLVTELDHPRVGKLKVVSPAVRYGQGRMAIERPPPVLGQHSGEVLRELGYADADIDELRQCGAVGPGQ